MSVGALFLLMLVPLAQQGVDAGQASVGLAQALGSLAVEANTMAYQIGQLSLGIGAIFLCSLLFRTRLIPRWLAAWGLIGYVLHAARRMSKDYERLAATSEAFIYVAMTRLMVRRLARAR